MKCVRFAKLSSSLGFIFAARSPVFRRRCFGAAALVSSAARRCWSAFDERRADANITDTVLISVTPAREPCLVVVSFVFVRTPNGWLGLDISPCSNRTRTANWVENGWLDQRLDWALIKTVSRLTKCAFVYFCDRREFGQKSKLSQLKERSIWSYFKSQT